MRNCPRMKSHQRRTGSVRRSCPFLRGDTSPRYAAELRRCWRRLAREQDLGTLRPHPFEVDWDRTPSPLPVGRNDQRQRWLRIPVDRHSRGRAECRAAARSSSHPAGREGPEGASGRSWRGGVAVSPATTSSAASPVSPRKAGSRRPRFRRRKGGSRRRKGGSKRSRKGVYGPGDLESVPGGRPMRTRGA